MNHLEDLTSLAAQYHLALPDRIRNYLNDRGIPDSVVDRHLLGWNGSRITIPIPDGEDVVRSLKLAKDPEGQTRSPKMLATPGARFELYGWEEVLGHPDEIIICEGEFDRLVLEAQGFRAVTSTGGAASFRPEWAEFFQDIPHVYLCFDRDQAGHRGVDRIARLIPHAKVIVLPDEVGEGGDVTDFFVRLGRNGKEFRTLMINAQPAPDPPPVPLESLPGTRVVATNDLLRVRIDRLKQRLPINEVIGRYVTLERVGSHIMGLCPFHEDRRASLALYPRTQSYYCFGCGRSGDIVSFVREVEHRTFLQALDRLEEFATNP